jgi:hypothetical protein
LRYERASCSARSRFTNAFHAERRARVLVHRDGRLGRRWHAKRSKTEIPGLDGSAGDYAKESQT